MPLLREISECSLPLKLSVFSEYEFKHIFYQSSVLTCDVVIYIITKENSIPMRNNISKFLYYLVSGNSNISGKH